MLSYRIPDIDALQQLASGLAKAVQVGDVITLDGPMGAGKTTLVQQLGAALGIQQRITSPTFVLVCEYHEGRLPLAHLDVYRLGEATDEIAGAMALAPEVEDLLQSHVTVVEWASYAPQLFEPLASLALQVAVVEDDFTANSRWLTLVPMNEYWQAYLASAEWGHCIAGSGCQQAATVKKGGLQ